MIMLILRQDTIETHSSINETEINLAGVVNAQATGTHVSWEHSLDSGYSAPDIVVPNSINCVIKRQHN